MQTPEIKGNISDKGHLAKRPGDAWVLDSKTLSREELATQLRLKMLFQEEARGYLEMIQLAGGFMS